MFHIFLIIKICVIIFIIDASKSKYAFEKHQNPNRLASAALHITKHYFANLTSSIMISEKHFDPKNYFVNANVLRYIFTHIDFATTLQLNMVRSEVHAYNVFIVDSFDAFWYLRYQFPKNSNERPYYFLIVLTSAQGDYTTTMRRIFKLCWHIMVVNVDIIIEQSEGHIEIYTFFPFSKNDACGSVEPTLINRFENYRMMLNNEMFAPKSVNFYGCPLHVAARLNPPYFMPVGQGVGFEEDKKIDPRLSGIDGGLLKVLSKALNFTIVLLSDIQSTAFIYPNGSMTGCFLELKKGKADIAIGGLSATISNQSIFSRSVIYKQAPLVFVIRKGNKFGPISQLAYPFGTKVWITLILLFATAAGVIQIILLSKSSLRNFVFGSKNKSPNINLVATALGYPITPTPRSSFARYVVIMWMLVMLILRSAYQGSLFDSIRMNKKTKLPQTIEELALMNYRILANTETYNELQRYPSLKKITLHMDLSRQARYSILENAETEKYAIVSPLGHILYINSQYRQNHQSPPRFAYLTKPLYIQQIAFYFPKNSYLQYDFNKLIRRMDAAGITKTISNKFTSQKVLKDFDDALDEPPIITNYRLLGLYEIYLGLLFLSLLIFGFELLSKRFKWLQRFFTQIHS